MKTLSQLALTALVFLGASASAEIYFTPAIGAGYNSAQGANYSVGADLGYVIDENWFAGVGGFYSFGNHPANDNMFGVGPYLGYRYPILSWLSVMAREDLDFVSQRDPYQNTDGSWNSTEDHGMESFTYVGLHVSITRNFGISAGYRAALGLGNSTIADGRSGTSFGLTLGF